MIVTLQQTEKGSQDIHHWRLSRILARTQFYSVCPADLEPITSKHLAELSALLSAPPRASNQYSR